MDSSRRALQTYGKLFSNYWLKTEKYSSNNKVGFMQARWERHLCRSARVLVMTVFPKKFLLQLFAFYLKN